MIKSDLHCYKEYQSGMILRDYLALDRTILANKRTLLAYVRTFVGLIAGGIGMVKVVTDGVVNAVGYVFIAAAFPIIIRGIIEYRRTKKELCEIEN